MNHIGDNTLKKIEPNSREALKVKMARALDENLRILSPVMQDIVIDDLVTAFENRLKVFSCKKSTLQYTVDFGKTETINAML
jgi:hypothetical protein